MPDGVLKLNRLPQLTEYTLDINLVHVNANMTEKEFPEALLIKSTA